MDSSSVASPEVYMSAEEVAEDIEFQKVLLLSLDDTPPEDRDSAEATIKAEIRNLEKTLKALRQGQHNLLAAAPVTMSYSYDDDPFRPGPATLTHGQSMRTTSSTSSTPNSTASVIAANNFLSPSQVHLPTRKRSHAEHLGFVESENKYRRTSPSPHITRSTTPSTSSGQEFIVTEDGFFDLTVDDDAANRELAARVRQRQRDAEEKANRERADADFARLLQYEISGNSLSPINFYPVQPVQLSAPSAYDKLLGLPRSNSQAGSLGNSGVLSNTSSFNQAVPSSLPVIKTDRDRPDHFAMPGAYQNSDSDSDVEYMPSETFYQNDPHTSFEGVQSHNNVSSKFLATGSEYGYGSVNTNSGPQAHTQFSPASETAGSDAASFIRQRQQQQQQQQRYNTFVTQKQLSAMSAYAAATNAGLSLPLPTGMLQQQPGFSSHSQQFGASSMSAFPNMTGAFPNMTSALPNTTSFGMIRGTIGPPGSRSILNQDPIQQMMNQSSGFNNLTPLVDNQSSLISSIDLRMSQLGNAFGNRLAEIDDYVQDPRRTTKEIQDLLENIRPDVEIPKENREGTPDGLKYALYEHQKLALTWLKQMEEGTNKGGILADDMGLGKTISALALILSRPSTDRRRKTTLIVGPVALVRQWEREIDTKIKKTHRLSTFLYHSGRKAKWDTLRAFDIVLTTYGTLGAEYKRHEEWRRKCDENQNLDRNIEKQKFPFLGDDSFWHRIILDEAQCIKNKATKAALAACHLKASTRFCLTGTPMMNGVHELFSLIRFLRIRPYNDFTRFTSEFGCLSKNGPRGGSSQPRMEKNAMKKLQAVLKAILLRRTKTSQIDGKPILTLPEKTEEIVHAIFNEDEQAYYTALETKTRLQFNKYVKAGTIGKNYSNILVLLLRLRQAACHPHLIMDFEEAPAEASIEDMITWAKTLLPEVVRRIIGAIIPFECPVCYDAVANPRIVIPCGHDTCSECLVKIAGNVQQEAIAEGNEAGDARCPTCRGKIDMKKIIDYETFKQVHMGDQNGGPASDDDETQSDDDTDSIDLSSETDSTDEGDGSDEDIRKFVVPDGYVSAEEGAEDDVEDDADCILPKKESGSLINAGNVEVKSQKIKVKDEIIDDEDDDEFVEIKDIKPAKLPAQKEKKTSKVPRSKSKGKRKSKSKETTKEAKTQHTSLAKLKREASRSKEGHRRYMRYLKKNWISSAKVDKCLEILRNTEPNIKTIIFSQFTTLLDLLEIPIRQETWGFMRYDGSMSAEARHHSVVKFTDDPRCKIMLVSLKAGNAGLNLVAASQVIILDPFWNPFIEMQAVDRAHRIGQQKPVKVHRILIAKTVEDRIIELQDQKRRLVEAALDEKASRGLGRLGRQELIYLFNGGDERETAPRPALVSGLGLGAAAARPAFASASPSPSSD